MRTPTVNTASAERHFETDLKFKIQLKADRIKFTDNKTTFLQREWIIEPLLQLNTFILRLQRAAASSQNSVNRRWCNLSK
jgi:hypothetical protein